MAIVLATNQPSFSNENPFLLVRGHGHGQPDASITYSIDRRARHIDGRQQQIFDRIFEEHAREWDSIADGAAAELIQLSNLPENVLAEIWDVALRAINISAPGSYETRHGYLSKDEFFILLSELQLQLGITDNAFSNTFSNTPTTLRARRNPFNRKSLIESITPPQSPIRAPPVPPKVFEDDWDTSRRSSIDIHIEEIGGSEFGLGEPQNVADGYSEYSRSFGSPELAQSSSNISTSCDFLLPVRIAAFPNNAKLSRSSDKEVVSNHWTPTLSKIQDEEEEEHISTQANSRSAAIMPGEDETAGRSYFELEVTPIRTRWDPDDFVTAPLGFKTRPNQTVLGERLTDHAVVSPRPQQEYKPLSTSFSDQLAVQRITSLVTSESTIKRKGSTRSIGSALQIVRKKTMAFKSKPPPPDPDKAPSGYLYTKLAEALQDSVAEGNISLVASLFKLGANVNYSSVKGQVYHDILQVAVASGHVEIVDFFIEMGADGISVDNALVTAFFADRLDLTVKLAPHANVYHLRPFDTSGPDYQKLSASSLGRVIRDRTMPAENRLRLLKCLFSQKFFDANRTVYQAYDTANSRSFEFSTLATLVAQLDVEGVKMVLPALGFVKRHTVRNTTSDRVHQMGAICCIRPSHWQLSSERACAMLEILVEHSADVGELAYWPGQGAMSPLACAVAGGSFEGISLLIALDADPECLIYQLQLNGMEAEAYSALGWAALQGRLDICTLLIDAGATPWRTSLKGYTPLYLACRGGNIEVVEYLLSLDVERSMVDNCLLAAVEGDEPRIVDVLLTVGAFITPETWIAVMKQPRKPRQRANFLSIIDLMLSHESIILEEPVLVAIDSDNFAGLSRLLERRNGELDFDKNAVFGNWRWEPGKGGEDCRDRTCLYYADQNGKGDFVALLGSYGWVHDIAVWRGVQAGYPTRH